MMFPPDFPLWGVSSRFPSGYIFALFPAEVQSLFLFIAQVRPELKSVP